jgi:hypothetical protein
MKIFPGLTFSWRRAIGLTALQSRVSRAVGVPLTRGGRQKKVGATLLTMIFGRKH